MFSPLFSFFLIIIRRKYNNDDKNNYNETDDGDGKKLQCRDMAF